MRTKFDIYVFITSSCLEIKKNVYPDSNIIIIQDKNHLTPHVRHLFYKTHWEWVYFTILRLL